MKFRMELCRQLALRYAGKMCECFAVQHHVDELNETDEAVKNQEWRRVASDPAFWEKRGDKLGVHLITCQKDAENYWEDPRYLDCNQLGLRQILQTQLSDDEVALLLRQAWPSVLRSAMGQYLFFAQSYQGFCYEQAARLRRGESLDDNGYEDSLFPD